MNRREHVITITRDLILAEGIQAASMSKIGKVTQVSIGSIYHMFSSKEALINEIYNYSAKQYLLLKEDVQSFEGQSFKEAVFKALYDYINKALNNPNDFLFVEQYKHSPLVTFSSKLNVNVIYGGMSINDAITHGIVKNLSLELSWAITYGIINSAIHAHLSGNIILDDENISNIIRATWDAIKK